MISISSHDFGKVRGFRKSTIPPHRGGGVGENKFGRRVLFKDAALVPCKVRVSHRPGDAAERAPLVARQNHFQALEGDRTPGVQDIDSGVGLQGFLTCPGGVRIPSDSPRGIDGGGRFTADRHPSDDGHRGRGSCVHGTAVRRKLE